MKGIPLFCFSFLFFSLFWDCGCSTAHSFAKQEYDKRCVYKLGRLDVLILRSHCILVCCFLLAPMKEGDVQVATIISSSF